MRRTGITLALLAILALWPPGGPAPIAAQESLTARSGGAAPAWLGISYEVLWFQRDDRCAPRIRVDAVVPGSPAERAGLRAGDVILALDSQPAHAARLQALAAALAPGDSVHLRFDRSGREREVTAVADRRPDRPALGRNPRAGLTASTAPVVTLQGDTLVARNVDGLLEGAQGYWFASGDGQTRFRRLAQWSGDPLDSRVRALLRCADTVEWEAPTAVRIDLDRVRARADSLRVVIGRRALSGEVHAEVRGDRPERRGAWVVRRGQPGEIRIEAPDPHVLRIEDYVAAGLRGVAGAELTPLEPELAEYFRNADAGLLVLRAAPGTPAHRAGLRPGDVIVAAAGRNVDSVARLRTLLASPGPEIELRVVRRGRSLDISLRRND